MVRIVPSTHFQSSKRVVQKQTQAQSTIQAWWQAVSAHCERFFEDSVGFNREHSPRKINNLMVALKREYTAIENAECPRGALAARYDLLKAMSDMIASFEASLSDNNWDAVQHLHDGLVHLQYLHFTLESLNLTFDVAV
jgi:hypothetical protein